MNVLFERQFDQSRWQLRFDIDRALRTVEYFVVGYGGHEGYLITSESTLDIPVEGWSEAYYCAVAKLWSKLEVQLRSD